MDDRKLPFMEHLGELRLRLRNSVIALLVACGVTYWWAKPLFGLLARPLEKAYYEVGRKDLELHYGSLTEGFWVHFEVAIYAGVFLASPVIFYQIWKFIAPGLYDKEKRVAIPFAACSALMFIGGALFAYAFVLPAAFRFFLSYSTENLGSIQSAFGNLQVTEHPIAIKETLFLLPYLEFARKMLLAFGLIFELPLGIFFLSLVGIVTHRSLWKWNKYWIILSFALGGLLTPGPDIMSQLLMALPLIVLYNLSIIIAWIVTRRREAASASTDITPVT
jgi:sec-independent protein translocase protein TatC